MPYDWERGQIDRIYETTENIAKQMRRVADDIDRAVQRAKDNEGSTQNFRSTYIDLPAEVANLVSWGMANAQLDSPARQVRELILGRAAFTQRDSKELADRVRAFSSQWKTNPQNSETVYSLMHTVDGATVEDKIDTDLLDAIANIIDPKGA